MDQTEEMDSSPEQADLNYDNPSPLAETNVKDTSEKNIGDSEIVSNDTDGNSLELSQSLGLQSDGSPGESHPEEKQGIVTDLDNSASCPKEIPGVGDAKSGSEEKDEGGGSEDKPNLDSSSSGEMDPSTLHYEGETCIYTDPTSKYQYVWDKTKNEWVARATEASYSYEGDTHTYTDPTDGTVYIWDTEKNAWFPKIDDDFLAIYQMNYGFTDPKVAAEEAAKAQREREEKEKLELEKALKRKAEPQPATWFEIANEHNTKVYVSNLPLDTTEQEFVDLMQKCGMVMRDVDTNKMKVKLYTETGDSTQFKGDALCTYIRIESVDLALNLLDGYEIRGQKISVQRAKFEMKGSYDPNLKPKKKRKKDKEKLKKQQEKLFDWRPEKMRGERSKHERVVIIKNLFDPKTFEKEVSLILEFQQDLREECSKCGDVKRVIIYDRHDEGVAQVTFSDPEEADVCIKLLHGRWFGQRKITAETWDGKTKYKVVETEAQTKARLEKWGKFLESEENKNREGDSETPKSELKMSDLEDMTADTTADMTTDTAADMTTNTDGGPSEEVKPADNVNVDSIKSDMVEGDELSSGPG